ncbi:MAG: glycerophosphodiester phosphodiesterase, partial [Acidimicrobiales bacterium]
SVMAHRGGVGPWKENTVAAFEGARRNGADGVEIDARLTGDGAVVVHHDAGFSQGDLAGRKIIDLRSTELPDWIPSLEAAVAACRGMLLDVEIKLDPSETGSRLDAGICRSLVTGIAEVLARPEKVFVSSFWPDALVAFGEASSLVPLGLLVHPAFDAVSAVATARDLGCSALHPHFTSVTPGLVERCHKEGLQVGTWTVNEPADLEAMLDAGVDAVISDDSASALRAVGRAAGG